MFHGCRLVVTLITAALVAATGVGIAETEDLDLVQVAKLVPFVELLEDYVKFGHSVSMDGDLMVVGAQFEDALDQNSGAAYVFVKAAGDWYLQTKLVPSDGAAFDEFGFSVAIDGLTVVVGAPKAHGPLGDDQGAAYVFARSTDGRWTEMAKLTAADGGANENFGHSVAASGDTVVVGAWKHGATAYLGGAAYVYERSGPDWPLQQKLESDDLQIGDLFGTSVAIEGDTAVVGAQYDDHPGGNGEGSAYVFTRAGTVWTQQQRLYAADAAPGDHFASSLAISGSTIVVGTWEDDHAAGDGAGSAYAFIRSGTVWGQQQKLVADDAAAGDAFGYAVDVQGDLAVVGAVFDDDIALDGGSAYVFERSGGFWSQRQELPGDVVNGDFYGCAVAVSGDSFAAGARDDDTFGGVDSGSVTTYKLVSDVWTWDRTLGPGTPPFGSGTSAALSGDTLFVGQYGSLHGSPAEQGAAHIFEWKAPHWVHSASIVNYPVNGLERFGRAVAIDGDTAVIGAPSETGGVQGWAAIFVKSGSSWVEQAVVEGYGSANGDEFGAAVAIDADTVVIGALQTSSPILFSGAAYIFHRSGTAWTEQARLLPADLNENDKFGISVAVDGDTAVVGAQYGDGDSPGTGSAYVFTRTGGTWTLQQKLSPVGHPGQHLFGRSVAVEGDTVMVGAPQDDSAGFPSGSVYVFGRSGTTWTQEQVLVSSDGAAWDNFGNSVALNADVAIIGSRYADGPGGGGGAAYLFTRSGGTWTEAGKMMPSDLQTGDYFGCAVDVDGDRIISSAQGHLHTLGLGATWVFETQPTLPFSDGFESGDLSTWSSTVP